MRTKSPGFWLLGMLLGAVATVEAGGQRTEESPRVLTPSISATEAVGHRLWILVFDISSMSATDLPRARLAATDWISTRMAGDDLVSVVAVGESLTLLQNFTPRADRAQAAVTRVALPTSSTARPEVQERDYFNNDLRFRGLRAVCAGLQNVDQRKAILFFTALRARPGADNQVEARAATAACNRAQTAINPIDVGTVRAGG